MDFIDMLAEQTETEDVSGNLGGVEIVSTIPGGITVGGGLIS